MAEQIEASGCRVIVMDKEKQGSRAVFGRILELCEEERVDAIIAHHAAPMLRLAAMAAKWKNPKRKVICYAHSNAFELCDGRRKKGLALRKWIYRTTFLRADAAVAISNSVKDSLVEYLGLPGSRLHRRKAERSGNSGAVSPGPNGGRENPAADLCGPAD